MSKYLLSYHTSVTPNTTTEEEQAAIATAWGAWMDGLGAALIDPGNATFESKTISADRTVTDGGGANPVTGYSTVEANSLDGAVALVKGCPIFDSGGRIEVGAAIEM